MTHREYRDEQDVVWQVWDIHPLEVARRLRTHGPESTSTGADVTGLPNASPPRTRTALSGELAEGWLCFESAREKRRLWPIPSGWEYLSDVELTALCASAAQAPERSRGQSRAHQCPDDSS